MLDIVRILNKTDDDVVLPVDDRFFQFSVPAHGASTLSMHDYQDLAANIAMYDLSIEGAFVEQDSYNVKRFGAKGDGITDDTDAIQRALDAAYTKGGGEVFVPSGRYNISRGISIRDNVGMVGEGDSSYLRVSLTNTRHILIGGVGSYMHDIAVGVN